MTDPVAVIVRFNGDADDLFEGFEKARQLWMAARQESGYNAPNFYAVAKTGAGIVLVDCFDTDEDHLAFGENMGEYLEAVGMPGPDHLEHLEVSKLGWDPVPSASQA
jgi:hypothetical protein